MLSRDQWLVWLLRPDVRGETVEFDAARGRDFLCWWLIHGRNEYPGAERLRPEEAMLAFEPVEIEIGARAVKGPAILGWLWRERDDLRSAFRDDPAGLAAWFRDHGIREARLAEFLPGGRPEPVAARRYPPPARRDGVNLIGYARGELGTGEDIRMAAQALDTVGLCYSVVEIPVGPNTRAADETLGPHISEAAPYAINIVCLPGIDATRIRLETDPSLWQGRTTVGWWPWELARWPAVWEPALALVDELWAPTRFVQQAYERAAPVPVRLMPPAVSTERARVRSRAGLHLPYGRFLFVFAFDGNSYLARKNPEAVVAAFRRAFPGGNEPVGLVVKAMNPIAGPDWDRLAATCAEDKRVRLIAETWEREDMLALIGACDAVVSLHRGEGFGRVLAEAMLMGKPLIATDYSGNADFLGPATGFPVRWRPRPVAHGEYPFGEGQVWADPDIDHAAALMRAVAEHPNEARAVAAAGRDAIAAAHGPAAVGRAMLSRLIALGLGAGDAGAPGRGKATATAGEAEPALPTRLLRLEPGLYALRIDDTGRESLASGGIRITSPPSARYASVDIVPTGEGPPGWVGGGGIMVLRVPPGGGLVLATFHGFSREAAEAVRLEAERL